MTFLEKRSIKKVSEILLPALYSLRIFGSSEVRSITLEGGFFRTPASIKKSTAFLISSGTSFGFVTGFWPEVFTEVVMNGTPASDTNSEKVCLGILIPRESEPETGERN